MIKWRNLFKKIKRYSIGILKKFWGLVKTLNFWYWLINLLLLICFIYIPAEKVIFGGILLILIGFKQYFIYGLTKKEPLNILTGALIIYAGVFALASKWILAIGFDAFIFISLFIVLALISLYSIIEDWFKNARWIATIFLIGLAIFLSFAVGPVLTSINSQGISNGWFYSTIIIFIILINFCYFKIIKEIFLLFNLKDIDFFALALGILIFILFSGYFYITDISKDNKLRDFLLILSIGFATVFGAISSIKYILEKKE